MLKGAQLVAFVVLMTACSSSTGSAGADRPTDTASPTAPTTTTIAEPTDQDIETAAVFLLSVDDALAGTVHEGAPLDDPETFLAMGRLFCDLLDSGLSIDEVLGGYAAAIVVQYPEEALAGDDLRLGGAVLGAAVVVLCPEYEEGL